MNTIEIINTPVSLEIQNPQPQLSIPIRQGETARCLIFGLLNGGKIYTPAENCTAVFTALKPDGKLIFNNCHIDGSSIIYPLSPQTTAAAGLLSCQLRIYDGEENLLLSPRFIIDVEQAVYSDDAVLESENEVTALTALIAESSGLIGEIRQDLTAGNFTPKLTIGSVSTLPSGTVATAEIVGSRAEPVLNLGIPQGPQGQAEHLIPDSELDENSLKPPQNRAVALAMAQKLDKSEFELSRANFVEKEAFSETVSNFVELEKYGNEMSKKVDKVSGKGLSTNDFTNAYKSKLEGIESGANKFTLADSSVTSSKIAAGAVSSSLCLCLLSENWQNNSQSLAHSAISANSNLIVSPREDSFQNYLDSHIRCTAQRSGGLTFVCEDVPEVDIYVNILLVNK